MTSNLLGHELDLADIDSSSILNSLPDGVYITDTDRKILFWNREAERMTGWKPEEVIGHRCHENILCHVDKDGHLLCGHEHCPLHRSMVTGIQSELPHLIFAKRRDGARIPVEVSVSPIRNAEGSIIGGIEVFRDLSPAFQDLNRARIIQQETVGMEIPPDNRLKIDVRFTPHDQVGGDFYRIERLHGDLYAILMADVIGHGISAALYAMQLRSLWEDGRARLDQPASFLNWLSTRVESLRDIDAGYFATAVYIVYDAGTGKLRCGTAGHPPPVIVRTDGSLEQLDSSGPGLGLLNIPTYDEASNQLKHGDHLVLFTDGAYEITNLSGRELGEEGLFELIRLTDLTNVSTALPTIEESLLRYTNELSLPDDLTLIHLQRM